MANKEGPGYTALDALEKATVQETGTVNLLWMGEYTSYVSVERRHGDGA